MSLPTARQKLTDLIPGLVLFLCLTQPLLDVISYWQREWEVSNTWTMILRLILLVAGACLGFLLSDRKWVYCLLSALAALYLTGHIVACVTAQGGYRNWMEDLTDQLRTVLLPITAVYTLTFLRKNKSALPTLLKGVAINLGIILLVELLSVITGTDPHTYEAKALGVRGWFIWTSPQSAILSIGTPLAIAWSSQNWKNRILPLTGICLGCFAMLFCFGTRLSIISLFAVGVGMSLVLLTGGKERRPQAAAVALCTILFLALLPLSPMRENRAEMEINAKMKQERIDAALEAFDVPVGAKTTQNLEAIEAAYHYNLQGMMDHFGVERVARIYDYTLDANVICDDRVMKTTFCRMLRQDASAMSRFFGLELALTRQEDTQVYVFETDSWIREQENYDPENDFNGVYDLCGWVGGTMLLLFLAAFGVRAAVALIRDPKLLRQPVFSALLGAYCIALVYGYFTASVLRRNNASVYFAWVLAALWYLSDVALKGRKENDQHYHSGL